jgi:hypothetical protein
MYWYYLTVKILLWIVLQVKRRRIRAHVLVLSYSQDSTLGSTPGKEEEDQGPCTGTILPSRFYPKKKLVLDHF